MSALKDADPEAVFSALLARVHAVPPGRLIQLAWSLSLYELIPILDTLIANAPGERGCELDLAACYWNRRQESPVTLPGGSTIRLVVHIRLGDSTAVMVAGTRIQVLNSQVMPTIESSDVLLVDPNRRPIEISDYKEIIGAILDRFGSERFSIILISDGFRRTFEVIKNAKRKASHFLKDISWRDIADSARNACRELDIGLSESDGFMQIIGESDANLRLAIHALASADIVLWGTGGFAYFTHTLLRRPDSSAITLHVRDGKAAALEQIGQFIETSKQTATP